MNSILVLQFWILDYRTHWRALFPSLMQNLKSEM